VPLSSVVKTSNTPTSKTLVVTIAKIPAEAVHQEAALA